MQFYSHLYLRLLYCSVLFYLFPVFLFEDDNYLVEETILFFAIIILILGAWSLLTRNYFKRKPVELESDVEIIDAEGILRT